MALGDPGGIIFASGNLSLTPSSMAFGTSYPWGGTALGLIRATVAKVDRKVVTWAEESLGPMPIDGIDCGEAWACVGEFRTYDQDVINAVFASTALGASTGQRQILYPNGNTYRTGGRLSTLGAKILLTPDDVENQRFLYFYNGVLLQDEGAGLPFKTDEEWVIPFRIIGLPDASNRTVAFALKEDLATILT